MLHGPPQYKGPLVIRYHGSTDHGRVLLAALLTILAGCTTLDTPQSRKGNRVWANTYDEQLCAVLAARAADWRNGAIVYQVIVDRFAPPDDLDAKRGLYPAPKRLRGWDELPAGGEYVAEASVWSHEIDFWGGDLKSLCGRLEYINQLGADVLYLNPIHKAYTNHKYDAEDYFAVSPEYGTREDVRALADACHERDMKLVLDGVFNHTGRRAAWFQDAIADAKSPYRDWYYIGDEYKFGYRAWANVANLPELRLENPAVQARIYGDADSVVQGYLREGVDGWRLDVAFDIGFVILRQLTEAAHYAKAGSLVVGEIWNYPEEWSPSVDAVMNFHAREIILNVVNGEVSGGQAGRMLDGMIADAGLEPILKSWIILDNHDTPRLATVLPKQWQRRMAQALQFTMPGSPCVYYGTELGMEGRGDPEMRAPMRWDLVDETNADYVWTRGLIKLRQENRALRIGDFRLLPSEKLLAFMRRTDRAAQTIVVIVNATDDTVTELLPLRESKLMNWDTLPDLLGNGCTQAVSGTTRATVPPHTIWILRPAIADTDEYSPYKRVQ
ncbi:MAG: glycoside hydrolase family 13 protein [Phycisphaerae bacterium]|nr:glycoside hydrolase family 13 protein [Phycisphaerae bacterium]